MTPDGGTVGPSRAAGAAAAVSAAAPSPAAAAGSSAVLSTAGSSPPVVSSSGTGLPSIMASKRVRVPVRSSSTQAWSVPAGT